jgi:CTP:molybdopterin cytidylyltransferase MocA
MIFYVVRSLRASARVGRICVCGPSSVRELLRKEEDLIFAESGEDAMETFANAVAKLGEVGPTEKLLVMPTDIPFITPEAIDDFVDKCEALDADFYYSVTEKSVNEAKFPGVKRTYVRLREGTFTGGNLFFIRTGIVPDVLAMGKKLVAKRKEPVAMARLFGLQLVLRYALGRLSIENAERRFEKVVGIKGKGVISAFAEVGVDVDKQSDLELAERMLGKIKM